MANGFQPEVTGEMRAWEPSPLERQRYAIADFLEDKGLSSDRYRARKLAENLTFLSEFIPGFGEAQGGREAAHMWGEGDRMMGGIMLAASLTPFVPGKVTDAFEALLRKIRKAKHNEQRELRNIPYDQTSQGNRARDNAERYRREAMEAQREARHMIEVAVPDNKLTQQGRNLRAGRRAANSEGQYVPRPGQLALPRVAKSELDGRTIEEYIQDRVRNSRVYPPYKGTHYSGGKLEELKASPADLEDLGYVDRRTGELFWPPRTDATPSPPAPSGGGAGGARPAAGEYIPRGESGGITDLPEAQSLTDVLLDIARTPLQTQRRGAPSTPEPEQEDMLTRLQNLKIDKND